LSYTPRPNEPQRREDHERERLWEIFGVGFVHWQKWPHLLR